MLPSPLTHLRGNGLHSSDRHVVYWMRLGVNDKRKSSLHGRLADRPADRDNKDLGDSHEGGGVVDEQGLRHEGIQ